MRPADAGIDTVTNGHWPASNGSSATKHPPPAVNGHDPQHTTAYTNGNSSSSSSSSSNSNSLKKRSPVRSPTWFGHDRQEVTRILIQGLFDLGYADAGQTLVEESGYELESAPVAAFRAAILAGEWLKAEHILLGPALAANQQARQPADQVQALHDDAADGTDGSGDGDDQPGGGGDGSIVLAEDADRGQMLFWIRRQKFLELLKKRDLGVALMVLRQELTPLHQDINQLHDLSSLLMCPPQDLHAKARWPATIEESRAELLQDLSRCIAPSVMIRQHRLAELLDQVKQAQINHCLYHNTSAPPCLYADHVCSRDGFPLHTSVQLAEHTGQVWHVRFSPDGSKLASASQDKTAIIYDTRTFEVLHRLKEHSKEVTSVAWSPDSKKLITCSKDSKARLWDAETGTYLATFEHRTGDSQYAITEAAWAPDSTEFVTASHDRKSTLVHWSTQSRDPLYEWPESFRTDSVAISPDGRRVVVSDTAERLHCFDLRTHREEFVLRLGSRVTGLTISRDSSQVLMNMAKGEVHMLSLHTGETVRRFVGQEQGNFMIRNCFGGAAENFVLSGSKDGNIYVWHKENESLIEKLSGHGKGQGGEECVNSVDWNPVDAGMFASGGDDRKVRIWTNSAGAADQATASAMDVALFQADMTRTSAIRSTL